MSHRARSPRTDRVRRQLGPSSPQPAWRATAATAAPAPAPAPRTQRGGACARNTTERAVTITTARHDEPEAARHRSANPAEAASEINRELRRGGPGEQVAGGDRRLDVGVAQPAAVLDDEPSQQRDVRRRTAEAGQSDPGPLASDRRDRDGGGAAGGGRARSRLDGQAGGDTLKCRTLKPVGGPLLKTLGAERGVEVERRRVPGERRPFEASAAARDGKVRRDGRAAVRPIPPRRCSGRTNRSSR